MRNILIGLGKGACLIILLWIVDACIAFVIFNRDTDISLVLPTWFLFDVSLCVILFRSGALDRFAIIGAVAFVLLLALLYLLPVNSNFPEDARLLNDRISAAHENKYNYAETLFFELEKRWTSPVRQYLLEPHKVFFIKSAGYFWNLPVGAYVDSNVQAHLYRNLLIRSKRFAPEEITVEQHFCTNSPHGVVVFKKNDEKVYADLWAVDNFSEYRFGQYTKAPCDTLTGREFELQ